MNIIWSWILVVGLSILLFNNPELAFESIQTGSQKAISLMLKLWAIYSIWLGLLKIVEATRLDQKIAKKMSRLIHWLIGDCDQETQNQIAINITSNLLGMGNACTPSGIKGMAGLDKGSIYITNAMAMFLILNVTSLQLVPTTIISLRLMHGSSSSSDILFPTLIATLVSTLSGVFLIKLCKKIWKDKP